MEVGTPSWDVEGMRGCMSACCAKMVDSQHAWIASPLMHGHDYDPCGIAMDQIKSRSKDHAAPRDAQPPYNEIVDSYSRPSG